MSSKRRFTRSHPTKTASAVGLRSLFSCGVGCSTPATLQLTLGVESPDAGVDLGLLVFVDPPRRYPFR
jgi:hypothetical protein